MKSGTEKLPRPHEVSLGKYLRTLAGPMSQKSRAQYVRLKDGSLMRKEKYESRHNVG